MTALALPALIGPLKLHDGWSVHWAPDLKDSVLRNAIFQSPRFAERIVRDLLGENAVAVTDPDQLKDAAQHLLDYGTPENLRMLGLMWLAPRLMLCLLDPMTRNVCGPLEKSEVAQILKYRDHTDIQNIPNVPGSEGVIGHGRDCLLAWVLALPTPISGRLRAQLPPVVPSGISHTSERAALFDLVLSDAEIEDY